MSLTPPPRSLLHGRALSGVLVGLFPVCLFPLPLHIASGFFVDRAERANLALRSDDPSVEARLAHGFRLPVGDDRRLVAAEKETEERRASLALRPVRALKRQLIKNRIS